ncbi:glycosyltransferase [Photobacterium sp. OFAV2-7]|uniref:glycosyltransferase n=1 Tax=Photobacterium sp. OFAV2-7 TaxID=2917748 RepID=UPI001EF5470C|nr:glycosyltransferase [Photobacterium sp. OFAV2-7]MCG7584537.1 glycosyltransferase [Photobacterium sp. OFAV2-7]
MKHVTLQIVQHLCPGGIERLVLNLLRFSSPSHDVYVVSLEGEKHSAIAAWPELQPFASRLFFLDKPKGRDLNTVISLRQLIKQLKVTTVHSHHLGPLLYTRLATIGLSLNHIQTEHDSWHLHDTKQRFITRWLLKGTNIHLIADAPRVAEQLNQYGITTSQVIVNGIDTEHFTPGNQLLARQVLQLPANQIIIGCAGRLVPEKGIDTMLETLTFLPDNHRLAIAGSGPEQSSLIKKAEQLGVSHRVHWLGHCANMRNYYRAIDIFCMPSRQEGLPLALLEAQACGKSVVATAVGGIPDLLCPHSGLLINPDEPQELARALTKGLGAAETYRESNAQYIRNQADVRIMTATYEALAHSN